VDVAAATELLDAEELTLSRKTAREIADIARCLSQLADQFDDVAQGMRTVEDTLGCPCDPGEEGMNVARKLLILAAQRPSASLSVRQPILEGVRDFETLTEFAAKHRELVESRARLSLQFKIDDNIDENQLKAAEPILDSAKGLFRLRSDWRSANAIYQALRHKKSFFRSTTKKAGDLRGILHYLQEKSGFERNSAYAGMLGPLFAGLNTPADDIWQVCSWFGSIREAVSDEPTPKGIAGQHLMSLGEEGYATFDRLAASSFSNACEFVAGRLRELDDLAPDIGGYIFASGWKSAAKRAAEIRDRVVHASERIALHCNDPSISVEKGQHLLQAVISLQTEPERLRIHDEFLLQPKRDTWSASDINLLKALALVASRLEREEPQSAVKSACVEHATSAPDAREKADEVSRIYERFVKARERVDEILSIDERQFLGQEQDSTDFDDIGQRLRATQVDREHISIWTSLASSAETVRAVTDVPTCILRLLFDCEYETGLFTKSVRYVTLARVANGELRREPILSRFSGDKYNELLQKFRDLDDRLRRVSSRDISNRLVNSPVPAGRTGRRVGDLTEMALLKWEMNKQRRHVPIRKLVHRAGSALITLKPCFMMGPLSVSQYLAPGEMSFDLVVMDEASQMRPEDALGAIARGKQLIVVGDPKQLPPTNFFNRLNQADANDDEDEELTFGSQESILDIAAPILGTSRILSWHYRSQHEDLIAFSNHSFYDNNLLLFPTAHAAADHLGVDYQRVDGTYLNHTNEEEAQQLITHVIHEIKSGRKRSVGIVAVNSQQAQVLRDIWDRNIREMPEIEEFLGGDDENNVLDSLFIKNLENVQGDERDVIFISLTYGRDPNGNFYQRFGPINRDVGWRRLNVLFTRAKQQMRIYSSMDSSMIVPGERANRGVIALKNFLSYCETKILPETPIKTGRGPDTPFEEDVAAEVRAFGLEIEYQVGVAGFFIDIGVYDPREAGHYLIGIECDGATYHSSRSARDRDKIRQEILEGLGWNIYRIWSTDWFHRGLQEREKLRHALQAAKFEADSRAESRVIEPEADEFATSDVLPIDDQVEATLDVSAESQEERGESLKSRFLDLRRTLEEEFPDVRPEHSLLSEDVLAALLRHRPTSLKQFHRSVPLKLRQNIDPRQSRAYLSTIMLMLEDA
jgi:very-short-patch-repair endonuclease